MLRHQQQHESPFDPFDFAPIATENRRKTLSLLQIATHSDAIAKGGAIYLVPGTEPLFFYYLTGLGGSSALGHALIIDTITARATIIQPLFDDEYRLWNGTPPSLDQLQRRTGVDNAVTELQAREELILDPALAILNGFVLESDTFTFAITEARVTKSSAEILLLRKAAEITCKAHKHLMTTVHTHTHERNLVAEFFHKSWSLAADPAIENCIVASSRNAAVLHYSENAARLPFHRPHDFIMVDAGVRVQGYVSDVSRTWPIGGVFDGNWRPVYEAVLDAHSRVCAAMQPGVEWEDMHRLADRVILEHLVEMGIVVIIGSGGFEELVAKHVGAVFFPHGVGHLIGLEGHDVGGYPESVLPIDEPGIKNLRMRRKLEVGMVVTVEPGCYFNSKMIANALKDENLAIHLNIDVLHRYESAVGGVRIEDMVLVTENGGEILSDSVPRTISGIEKLMKWQSRKLSEQNSSLNSESGIQRVLDIKRGQAVRSFLPFMTKQRVQIRGQQRVPMRHVDIILLLVILSVLAFLFIFEL
ncbi:hypothetical protein HK100_011411 [Physocladia obscura]|uniref:Peptidase M24 domain-containing protein n=1 Tax=Physocladia obscura TaxID=109957 RepID=A0AAD5T788_9FUNG|nr:hypothetical protein HK100_011411 [Physocladia obscura]